MSFGHPPLRRARRWLRPLLAAVLCLGAAPGLGTAAQEDGQAGPTYEYVFHLRNGSTIRSAHYTEHGNEYRFERAGGFVGLNKVDVVRIERVQVGTAPAPPPPAHRPAEDPRQEPSAGVLAAIQAYIQEMIEWMRAWLVRLWIPRQTGGDAASAGVPAGAGGPAPAPAPGGPPPIVLAGIALGMLLLLFGGRLLGARLFRESRA